MTNQQHYDHLNDYLFRKVIVYYYDRKGFINMLKYTYFLLIITVSSCSGFQKHFDNYNIKYNADTGLINDKNEVRPVEIKMPFFWMVRPWKEGKLVTLDGWGRYAEIFFIGKNKLRLKHLVDFPGVQQDGWGFVAFPEAGLIASRSGKVHLLAAIDDGKIKSHIPLLTWVHNEPNFILLDPGEGLAAYQYGFIRADGGLGEKLFIYNYKTDAMIYETPDTSDSNPQDNTIDMQFRIDENYIWSNVSTQKKEGGWKYDTVFYDWKKGEIRRNKLTEFLCQNNSYIPYNYIHLGRRYLFADVEKKEEENPYKLLKIDWDEDYSNLQITDLDYLFRELYKKGYAVSDIIISSDGSWVTAKVTDYSEYNPYDANHFIKTRVFFHIDNKYLNGISMPVFSDGRETMESTNNDEGAFVRHPVYGMCYAQEWHREKEIYLRLYKMDDVLAVINSGAQSVPFNYDNSKTNN